MESSGLESMPIVLNLKFQILTRKLEKASSNMPNLIDFTFQQHREVDESLAFSLCFGYDGGFMTLGGYNAEKHFPNASTSVVPYVTRSGQYTINIHKAKVFIGPLLIGNLYRSGTKNWL